MAGPELDGVVAQVLYPQPVGEDVGALLVAPEVGRDGDDADAVGDRQRRHGVLREEVVQRPKRRERVVDRGVRVRHGLGEAPARERPRLGGAERASLGRRVPGRRPREDLLPLGVQVLRRHAAVRAPLVARDGRRQQQGAAAVPHRARRSERRPVDAASEHGRPSDELPRPPSLAALRW